MEDLKGRNFIYKIVSPSSKVYIGQTTNISKRRSNYSRKDCKSQRKLYNSIKKYGWENHTFEIIEECLEEDLNCRERYWQDFYNVLGKNGLNCVLTQTDTLRKSMSEETKQKIRESNSGENNYMYGKKGELHHNFGKKASKKTVDKLSNSLKNYFSNNVNHFKGKKHKEESKKIMSEKAKGRKWTEEQKLKMENRFAKENNPNWGKKASDETREKQSKAKLGKKRPESFGEILSEAKGTKLINTQTKQIYNSIKKASEITGIAYSTLYFNLKSKNNNTNIIYLSDYNSDKDYSPKTKKETSFVILNTETGIFYESLREAYRETNLTLNKFRNMLIGKIENTTNYKKV